MAGSRHVRPRSLIALATALVAALAGCVDAGAPSAAGPSTGTAAPNGRATPETSRVPSDAPDRPWPAGRSSAAMAWDPRAESVVLFGGDTMRGPVSDLYGWDGEAWRLLAAAGPRPRMDAVLVADLERGVLVLHGGRMGERVYTDTWTWDGEAWTEANAPGPPARVHPAAAFDQESGRILLYGGFGVDDGPLADTWAWDGAAWSRLDAGGIPDRAPAGMAWDGELDRVVMLVVDLDAETEDSLYPSELWAWSGASWTRLPGDGPRFSPLQPFVEGPRHPWLVDGGVVQGAFATLEWTGEAWTPLGGPAPPVRNGHVAAFDAVRHQLVLFGGFVGDRTFDDLWLLDGGAWREVRR